MAIAVGSECQTPFQVDPATPAQRPAMEQNHHYAAQNRKEEVAISKHLRKMDAQKFGAMLDLYDTGYLTRLSSITVPEPKEMVDQFKKLKNFKKLRQLKMAKNKPAWEEMTAAVQASAAAQRACRDFLNDLIELLPHKLIEDLPRT